jgi:hypothetical protein
MKATIGIVRERRAQEEINPGIRRSIKYYTHKRHQVDYRKKTLDL